MSMGMSEKMSKPFWKLDWKSYADKVADEAGEKVLSALQQECPVGDGDTAGQLRDSLQYQKTSGVDFVRLEFTSDVPYCMFVIKGTADHDIFPVNGTVLHFFASSGEEVYAQSVHHPGSAPNAFHERAWDGVKDDITLLFGQSLKTSIT